MIPPIKNFLWKENISQMFGVGRDTYFPKFGIPGHNGIDIVIRYDKKLGFGTEVIASHRGRVWALEQDVPLASKGNGIYLISEDGKFATIYWHLSQFHVGLNEEVQEGQVIGLMGNSGFVFPTPSSSCPHCGTHLHFGFYIFGKENDYRGFVDPTPMLMSNERLPIFLGNDLFYGSRGDEVSWLQTILRLEGFAQDYDPIGFYGYKTLRDVRLFQEKLGFGLATGYCGPKTREAINKKWSIYYT